MNAWVEILDEGYFGLEELWANGLWERSYESSYEELDEDLKEEEKEFNSVIFKNWIIIEECWDDDPIFTMISCNITIYLNSYRLSFI